MWEWLKSKLTGKPPQRDVSRLHDGEATRETVKTDGKPLKPQSRRRALRDTRLLPKARGPLGRTQVMTLEEAQRFFSESMRTRNRQLRDLLGDEDQLRRLNLPLWRDEHDVAVALGVKTRELWWWAMQRDDETSCHYVSFAIPKASGGERLILAPKRRLKQLQRRLNQLLVAKLPVSEQAHGFVKGRSIASAAAPHVGKRVVVRLDLQEFFPSVTWKRVRGLLIAYGYSYPVANCLALLTSECQRQPVEVDGQLFHVPVGERHCVQGAPTSPGLCNALVLKLDRRLQGLARRFGCSYTRYADDLSFSGDLDHRSAHALTLKVAQIVTSEGFSLNSKKTKIMGKGRRQTVTGVVVNQVAGRSRQERRRLRAALHRATQVDSSLQGKLAFLWMLNPHQASALWPSSWAKPRG